MRPGRLDAFKQSLLGVLRQQLFAGGSPEKQQWAQGLVSRLLDEDRNSGPNVASRLCRRLPAWPLGGGGSVDANACRCSATGQRWDLKEEKSSPARGRVQPSHSYHRSAGALGCPLHFLVQIVCFDGHAFNSASMEQGIPMNRGARCLTCPGVGR